MDQEMLIAVLLIVELAILVLVVVIWSQQREFAKRSDIDNLRITSVENLFKLFRKEVDDYRRDHEKFEIQQMEEIKGFIDRHDEQIEAMVRRHLKP